MYSFIENKEITRTTDGLIVVDSDLTINLLNEAAQKITGFNSKELHLKDFRNIFAGPKEYKLISDALKENKTYSNISMDIMMPDSSQKKVLASLTPFKDSSNTILGVIIILRDVDKMFNMVKSLQVKTSEALDEKNKLEAIFHSRSEGTFTIDKEWTVTSFNRAAEKITGFDREDAIGRKCWEIFHSRLCRNGCQMEYTMSTKNVSVDNELTINHKDGKQIPIRVNSAPLLNTRQEYIGGIETFRDISEIENLKTHLAQRFRFENLIGHSKVMQRVYDLLENVAQSDSTVLITGESGTGKELVARAIHLNSERRSGPFIVVNCSAFAESLLESELFGHERGAFTGAIRSKQGHFELAQNGTLFLDEIGDISLPVQVKLLRVIETHEFERVGGTKTIRMDVRIIAATNRNLQSMIKNGRFREDLFYRINVFNIHLPPFRERLEDLPILLEHFLKTLSTKFNKEINNITPAAYNLLENHNWPGNIRELENVLEHAFVLCHSSSIQAEHLPEWFFSQNLNTERRKKNDETSFSLQAAERDVLITTLRKYNGHRGKTARALGMDKSTLWRKMKKFELI